MTRRKNIMTIGIILFVLLCALSLGLIIKSITDDNELRNSFLIHAVGAEVEERLPEEIDKKTWYIILAVDNSSGVIQDEDDADSHTEDAYRQQIKNLLDRLSSEYLMSNKVEIFVKLAVFDGNIDDVEQNWTVHVQNEKFLKITNNKENCSTLKECVDEIDFSATSTFVHGAVEGCQNIIEQDVDDEKTQTMIVLLTDGFNENYSKVQEKYVDEIKNSESYNSENKMRPAEVVWIDLNFPTKKEKTVNGRNSAQKLIAIFSKKTRLGKGVFEEGRNWKEVTNISDLEVVLWDICNYISPNLEKVRAGSDDLSVENKDTRGVEYIRLFMIKPDNADPEDRIEVSYNNREVKTEPYTELYEEYGDNAGSYCETVVLESFENAAIEDQPIIKYAGQESNMAIYSIHEVLSYKTEFSCRVRTEEDANIKELSPYIGEITIIPNIVGRVQDPQLQAEICLLDSVYEMKPFGNNDGSYKGRIPISNCRSPLDLQVRLFSKNDNGDRLDQHTINVTVKWRNDKIKETNYVEGRTVYEYEKDISAGKAVIVELDKVMPGIPLHDIKVEVDPSYIKSSVGTNSVRIQAEECGVDNCVSYIITGLDENENDWSIVGKFNVKRSYFLIILGIIAVIAALFTLFYCIYVNLTTYIKITIEDKSAGYEYEFLINKIDRKENNLESMVFSTEGRSVRISDLINCRETVNLSSIQIKKCLDRITVVENSEDNRKKTVLNKQQPTFTVIDSDSSLIEISKVTIR